MLLVQLTKELNALIAELSDWREVGHALKRIEPRYPDLAAALAEARVSIRQEAIVQATAPKPTPRKRRR